MSDPFDDFDRYMEENYRWEQRRPVCAYCHEHIMAETAYEMDNGDIVCPDCLEDYLKEHPKTMLSLAVERAEEYYEIDTNERMEEE